LTSPDGAGPDPEPTPPPRLGAGTFTIEGRAAPALFVVGWLATLLGFGVVVIGVMSGAGTGAVFLVLAGLILLSVGLVAGAGSQGIERRVRGTLPYQGPSPLLVFIAAIPVSLVAVVVLSLPLVALGVDVDSPFGRFLSVAVQTLVYVGLIRLLVVDAGALSWAEMGIRRLDGRAVGEMVGGAAWAIPVILVTIPVSVVLLQVFPVTPVSPLPATGELTGFLLQFAAGAIIAPVGEELLFRGLATTAWVRGLGVRQGLIRAALVFALAHVLTITGSSTQEAFGLAVVGFATRVPVALALGWLFIRRGSIWAPLGLHMAFNGILLVLGELALRNLPQ
jgi:membrane protease YdiL (CAAX protease family)